MEHRLQSDAMKIIRGAIRAVQPDGAVVKALAGKEFPGRVILVSVGKAAWQMARAAHGCLGGRIDGGIVITKYGHAKGKIGNFRIFEAGHPVVDENSFRATRAALELVRGLGGEDTVLFLLSGGGSALFEMPLIPDGELGEISRQLLASGADIVEVNTVRKRLSAVKGGRFGEICAPARVFSVVLSDIVGDPLDMIASGPACPDSSTCAQALAVAEKYGLRLSRQARECLCRETPKELPNAAAEITGSVRALCAAAAEICRELGYEPRILTDRLGGEARAAGEFLASVARCYAGEGRKLAFLAGGETVVKVTGSGKGGRNQELALSAAEGIAGLENVLIFSVGSDGTDGPTDAAGGMVDGSTARVLAEKGISIPKVLSDNDSYHALDACGGLIFTGSTGTNVNDMAVVLIG